MPTSLNRMKLTAIECQQNNKTFYIAILSSSILKETCYVARRDEDPEKGFQRVLNKSRAKEIASYLDDEKGVIPSTIILSAQDHLKLEYDKKSKKIVFNIVKYGFLVIDGQHRLYGLLNSQNEYRVPVTIFNNLTTADEVSLFIDINTTQKGVPTTLLLDIKHLSGKETKKEEKLRELFDLLNKDSCVAGLLSPTKSRVGKISRTTFNRALETVFDNFYLQDKSVDIIYKAVKNYLEACERAFLESKNQRAKLTSSVFFKALFEIFNEVLEKSLKDFGNLKTESIYAILEPISRLNYDTYTGSNKATQHQIVNDMKREIYKHERLTKNISEDIF